MLNVIQSDAAFEYSHHVNSENGSAFDCAAFSFHQIDVDDGDDDARRRLMCFPCSMSESRQHHIPYTLTHIRTRSVDCVRVYVFINIIHIRCY